jgi:hypothetical protein
MEIKSRMTSQIQPRVTSENTETKNSAVQNGVANVRDGFETTKASSEFVQSTETSSRLGFVKKQMGNFMTSNSSEPMGSLFTLMMEYQKLAKKEACEDTKVARDSKQAELSAKQSKLITDDKEIRSAKGARDMYQVVDSEASLEFFIGESSRLVKGDTKNDIDAMSDRLNELKKSAAEVKAEILQKGADENNVNKRYEMLISWLDHRKDD